MPQARASRPNPRVAVTDVVRVVRCEQQAQLDARFGERRDAFTETRRREGIQAHTRFERNDRRCYIATAVFGAQAPETIRLRAWRDAVLMPSPLGRRAVRLYYAMSPWCLRHCPVFTVHPARIVLRWWSLRCAPASSVLPATKHEAIEPSLGSSSHPFEDH